MTCTLESGEVEEPDHPDPGSPQEQFPDEASGDNAASFASQVVSSAAKPTIVPAQP
jgi:hypothetical protein